MFKAPTNKYLIFLTPIVLFLYLLLNGILGIHFGYHWDEYNFIYPACTSVEDGIFLPHNYIYPSLCYYIELVATFAYKFIYHVKDATTLVENRDLYIYMRYVFLFISSLTVFWVYILTFKITKNFWSSLIAGLVICASFEFSYHSRWAVSDCIAVQFAFLSTMFLFMDIDRRKKIILSSIIAGLAAGTKYTAGIVIINVLIFIIDNALSENRKYKFIVEGFILSGFSLLIGFIISTPGVIFEYTLFHQGLIYQRDVYSYGHVGNTVNAGIDHFHKIWDYVILVLFSKNIFISFFVFMLVAAGIISAYLKKVWNQFGLFLVMLIYIIYVSTFKVMIVRNLLFILPNFAVLAAIGYNYIRQVIQKYKFRHLFIIFILCLFCYSCVRVFSSTMTIYNKGNDNLSQKLRLYLMKNNDKKFIFTPVITTFLNLKEKTDNNPSEKIYLVFLKSEIPDEVYPANIFNLYETIGIENVNFNYYPNWYGGDRIVIMKYSNIPNQMLTYFHLNKKLFDIHEIKCDMEKLTPDKYFLLAKEYINDSAITEDDSLKSFSDIGGKSNDCAHSGKYSIKLTKEMPVGFKYHIPLIYGNHYYFSVWRKNPKHIGSIIIQADKFWMRSSETFETDSLGWEETHFDYFANDSTIKNVNTALWQLDSLTTVYFDDFRIFYLSRKNQTK